MKQAEDRKTIELPLETVKRGRGRPAKPDALSAAERAKRYRDAKRSQGKRDNNRDDLLESEIVKLRAQLEFAEGERTAAMDRCAVLQKKFDLEHLALVNAQTQIAHLELAASKPPKVNPLAVEVRALKKELVRRDEEYRRSLALIRDGHEKSSQK